MIKGNTSTGFAFEVGEEVLDNMELVDLIAEGAENPVTVSKIMKMVIGEEQRKRLYDHLRLDDGRVPTQAVGQALTEIFKAFGEKGKNC